MHSNSGRAGLSQNFDSIEQFIAYKQALRSGELPAHINPDARRGSFQFSSGGNRIARLFAYLVLLLVAVPSLIYRPAYQPGGRVVAGATGDLAPRLLCPGQ